MRETTRREFLGEVAGLAALTTLMTTRGRAAAGEDVRRMARAGTGGERPTAAGAARRPRFEPMPALRRAL